uniref:CSRNP_N domain-containing protein n=1 Tax=Anopheles epiroticus TaxID=199890 RepID=A0A182PAM1_9DIPT
MGPNEAPRLEETIIVSDELGLEEGGDPLHDPLALDDCLGPDLNVSNTSVGSEDDDGISPDKIILVDVTTLKPKEENEDERETDDDDAHVEQIHTETPVTVTIEDDDEQPITDLLNGSAEALLELEASESNFIIDRNEVSQIDSEQSSSCNVLDTSAIVEDGIRLSVSPPLADESETTDGVTAQLNGDFVDTIDTVEQDGCSERTGAVVVAGETTTAEQIQGTNGEEEEEASDGSDSGLGLEPARNVTGACASSNSSTSSANNSSSNSPLQRPPIKSSLKRRSEPLGATEREVAEGASSQKRPKKGITFDGVTVYYFPRIQGFGCVPSQGGCTLGMEFQHVHTRRLTLSEHSAEQRKVHRQQLQELNPRSSSSEDTSSEEEPSESGSEAESESYGFLQPVSTRQRRALLKAAGVRKIDPTEKDDCREIRISREVCGCTCRGFCDPNRCACSLAGIKCQVDRPNFPCGCTHEGCANTAGRVEFNPGRVRTHFLHTIMKLRMEGESSKVIEARSGSSNGAMLSRPAPADSDAENCDLNVTVISDSSRSTLDLDSSGEVTILEPPEDLPSEGCVIDDRDEEEDHDGHSGARATNRTKRRIADFIDLETPQADNMERLEAINDLLESSRHTRSIVQRSIVAEEDDELRDFQHPPAEPSVVICLEADEAEEDA